MHSRSVEKFKKDLKKGPTPFHCLCVTTIDSWVVTDQYLSYYSLTQQHTIMCWKRHFIDILNSWIISTKTILKVVSNLTVNFNRN